MGLKLELLGIVKEGETVAGAMRRLSASAKAASAGSKKSRGGGIAKTNIQAPLGKSSTETNSVCRDAALLDRVTEIANDLLSHGITGIYDMSFAAIEASTVQWEYRALDGTIQGPFTSQQIAEWKTQGYFTGPSAVMMRRVGIAGEEWNANANRDDERTSSKKRKGIDPTSASKRVKFEDGGNDAKDQQHDGDRQGLPRESKDTRLMDELMDDFNDDDDDDDDDNDASTDKGKSNIDGGKVSTTAATASLEARGPWVNSDAVDFGEYVNLGAPQDEEGDE